MSLDLLTGGIVRLDKLLLPAAVALDEVLDFLELGQKDLPVCVNRVLMNNILILALPWKRHLNRVQSELRRLAIAVAPL